MSFSVNASDPSSVLDAAALARLAELDPQGSAGLVQRVLATYANALERSRQELLLLRQPMQHEPLRHLAHTLKSSSASVGALALSALCAQVEHNVRSQQSGDIGKLLDAMQAEMQRVASAVQTMLRR
ncbi:MAG TPA: Hpt domain-containing protein [Burkholderiaceae bacterium]|nr:Hpt domain-containing protein [Burkholderiaceae bacterium]